jgi:hypothetical protein
VGVTHRSSVLADLIGRWAVERQVADLRSGARGRFEGVAVFEPDGRWLEEGTLELGGYRGPARRELRIADGIVRFAHGRPFHPLDLDGHPVEHLCGADRYSGRYRFLDPDALEVVWSVSGPEKEQRITSVYRRIG